MKARRWDPATVLLSAGVIVVLGLVVRREYLARAHTDVIRAEQPVTIDHARAISAGHWIGPDTASVTVVEFADLDCPACRLFYESWEEIRGRYGDDVALVFRHLPLTSLHPRAYLGALAVECAAEQGRFVEFYHAANTLEGSEQPESWESLALAAGVDDAEDLRACLASERHRATVERDIAEIRAAGVRGTPAIVIDGQVHVGAMSVEELTARLEAAGLDAANGLAP